MRADQTPFSTHFSGSAKETELRLRSIFQWEKRRPPILVLALALLLAVSCGSLIGCRVQQEEKPAEPLHAVEPTEKVVLKPRYTETDPTERQARRQKILDRMEANKGQFHVPDARKGESTVSLEDVTQSDAAIPNPGVVRLASFAEQNIYLYGYCDAEYFGKGLILDMGSQQTLYPFPYRYSSWPTASSTECLLDEDGTKLYLRSSSGGSNQALDTLIVLDWSDGTIRSGCFDVDQIGNAILDAVKVEYDTETQKAAVSVNDDFVVESSIRVMGPGWDENPRPTPTGYNCLDWMGLQFEKTPNGWNAHTAITLDVPGGVAYLEAMPNLTAEVRLAGLETGRCEVTVHTPTSEEIESARQG